MVRQVLVLHLREAEEKNYSNDNAFVRVTESEKHFPSIIFTFELKVIFHIITSSETKMFYLLESYPECQTARH